MKFIEHIFSVKNSKDNSHKNITLLGFKVKLRKKTSETITRNMLRDELSIIHRELNRNIQKNLSICIQHQKVFPQYKNIHNGQEMALICTGPTLKYFEGMKDLIYVGCNAACKYDKLKLDYLFMQDYEACIKYIYDLPENFIKNCKLFYGYTTEYNPESLKVIPEDIAIKHGAQRYYTDWANIRNFKPEFVCDISTQPLCCFGTVAFPAIQFIFWTNPKRIYLVGCDCSTGHYDGTAGDVRYLIKRYQFLKSFAQRYYPETEIISVNPVGLKGMFRDVYTESYLEAHPELKNKIQNIELLSQKMEGACK